MDATTNDLVAYLRDNLFADQAVDQDPDFALLEKFRAWYEARLHSPTAYKRHIAAFPLLHKISALGAFLDIWNHGKDLRHLNFCLKLRDDIAKDPMVRENPPHGDFQRQVAQMDTEIERLYERYGIS